MAESKEELKSLLIKVKEVSEKAGLKLNICSRVGRINIVKKTILPNAIYRFNASLIKLPMAFFKELEQKISQLIWKYKRSPNSQSSLEKEWSWRNQLSWLQIMLQSYSPQDTMVLAQKQKYRSMEQDRKPRNKLMHLCTLILRKEARIYHGAKTASSINGAGKNWTATCQRMKWEHFLTPYTKINSKWIKDLNVRPETIKLLEENISRTLNDINQSKILYDPPLRVMELKTKVNKWD